MISSRTVALFLGLLCIVGLTAVRIVDPFPSRVMREVTFDMFQRLAPRPFADFPVRIVDVDEASLKELGQWPWPRDRLAEMTTRLQDAGAAVVVFDFIFSEPDRLSPSRIAEAPGVAELFRTAEARRIAGTLPDNDRVFAEAMAAGPVVLGFGATTEGGAPPEVKAGFAFTGETSFQAPPVFAGATPMAPYLAENAAGIGSLSLSPSDSFGVVRETPLIWSDGEKFYPSLAAEALRVAQGAQTIVVFADPEDRNAIEGVRIGAFEVPTDQSGALTLYYTTDRPERYVSARDLFDDARLAALAPGIEGRIVLVGASATGLYDIRLTTLGQSVPGVLVHAQVLEQILSGAYLYRADWVEAAEIALLFITGALLIVVTLYSGARSSFFVGMVIAATIGLTAWIAFEQFGVLIDPSFTLVGGFIGWFASTTFQYVVADRDKRVIRHAFSHYVAPTILSRIEAGAEGLKLGGEIREITVMFSDVRGFTPLSETMTPTELVAFLNKLLGQLSAEIVAEGGTIDKYIGDSVMAFWNAPVDTPGHALRACLAALEMRKAVQRLNEADVFGLRARRGDEALVKIGVGLNTGSACVGNVGSMERFDYSAVGDAVNVASRVESACKELGFDIVVSEATRAGAMAASAGELAFLEAGGVALKGKSAPERVHILVGDEALRKSVAFCEFETKYKYLLRYAAGGDETGFQTMMAQCLMLADAVNPMLRDYLERLRRRREDFRPAEIAGAAE